MLLALTPLHPYSWGLMLLPQVFMSTIAPGLIPLAACSKSLVLLGSPGHMILGPNAADPVLQGLLLFALSSQSLILPGSRLMLLMQFSSQHCLDPVTAPKQDEGSNSWEAVLPRAHQTLRPAGQSSASTPGFPVQSL